MSTTGILEGKVAAVPGAGHGIGRKIVLLRTRPSFAWVDEASAQVFPYDPV